MYVGWFSCSFRIWWAVAFLFSVGRWSNLTLPGFYVMVLGFSVVVSRCRLLLLWKVCTLSERLLDPSLGFALAFVTRNCTGLVFMVCA